MRLLKILLISTFYLSQTQAQESIYDIEINDISGNSIHLSDFKGMYIIFVNVASECGFTSQYKALEELYQNYRDDLVVIGVPCNQFGGQEPGTEEEIRQFCVKNYGVSFLLTEKVEVKGRGKHPLYAWLTDKNLNGELNSAVLWNFQKYILSPEGKLINFFYSGTSPMSEKITSIFIK